MIMADLHGKGYLDQETRKKLDDVSKIMKNISKSFGSVKQESLRGLFDVNTMEKNGKVNIVGSINGYAISSNEVFEGTGAIRTKPFSGHGNYTSNSGLHGSWDFDASRIVPTANENRPKNTALLYVIKY